jgi:FSR family fosmidomycin resistance protein-like MFS transporter
LKLPVHESEFDLARSLLEDGIKSMSPVPITKTSHTTTISGAAWLGAVHLIVDAVCVTSVLRASPPGHSIVSSALAFVLGYDLLAFAGQAPLGWLADRLGLRRGAALAGLLCTAAALLAGRGSAVAVVLIAGVGNALFHVGAGAMVLAGSQGRAAPAGVFVAPGALGLGLGLLLGRKFLSVPLWPWLFAIAAACIVVLLVATDTPSSEKLLPAHSVTRPAFQRREIAGIVALLAVSVAVRSLAGTVGCDGCPRGLFLMVALPVAAFTGKLTGGFLADRFGWLDLSVAALLASAPLLAFSGGDGWLALPGMVIFQMTMPVTLAAMMRLLPARPAFGFGLLCVALVAGTLPAYLPGGWRPQGLPLFFLVLGSAAALYLALRLLLSPRPLPSVPSLAPDPSTFCGDHS